MKISLAGCLFFALSATSAESMAACFHSGSCYRIQGYAQGANFGNNFGSYNLSDGPTQRTLDFTYLSNHGISKVSLDDASIRLFADTRNSGSAATASGTFVDSVKFSLPTGVSSIQLPISVVIDGFNTHRPGASYNNISFTIQMVSRLLPGSNSSHFDRSFDTKTCGFDATFTSAICKAGQVQYSFLDTITIWDDVYYEIQMNFAIGGTSITQDFLNTSAFSWTLPSGTTYVSGSGVFLTKESQGAVPEPAIWVSLILGFGTCGSVLRMQRRAERSAAAKPN